MKRTLVEVSDAKGISGEASQVGEFRENCCPGKRVSQGSGNNAAEIRMFKYICRGPGRDEERIPGDQRKLILIVKYRHAAELNPVGWKEKLNKLGYVTEEFPQNSPSQVYNSLISSNFIQQFLGTPPPTSHPLPKTHHVHLQ